MLDGANILKLPEKENIDKRTTDLREIDDKSFLARCKPMLQKIEKTRRVKKLVYEFRKKIAYPVLILLTPPIAFLDYLLLTRPSTSDDDAFGVTFLFLSLVFWWVTQPKRQYAKTYKKEMMPEIVSLYGNFIYDVEGKIDMDLMEESQIIPKHNRYKSEDYFVGSYRGVDIEFSEINLVMVSGSGKNKSRKTVFKGLAILLDMNDKRFYGQTILDRNKSKMGEWFKEKSSKLERANLVDPAFEKIFDVYTNDQVEARYLVDPVIMEQYIHLYDYFAKAKKRNKYQKDRSWITRLAKIDRFNKSGFGKFNKKMMVSYYDSKVLILIGSDYNHFEPADLNTPATEPESILQMKREVSDILSIIDRLEAYDPSERSKNAN